MKSVKNGIVIDLFSNRSSHKKHFSAVQEILAARIVKGRLYLELYVSTPTPPDPYYRTLTCTVEDPLRGTPTSVKIEAVTDRDGHHVMVRSEPLGWAPEGATPLSPSAIVRISSDDGRMLQNMLQPLLEAQP
jgi:hypothetical protein